MTLKDLILKLSELETEGLLNPQGIFTRMSQDQIETTLSLVETALRFGVPKELAYQLFGEQAVEAPSSVETPVEEPPQVEAPPQAEIVKLKSISPHLLLGNDLMYRAVRAANNDSDSFELSVKEICRLAGVEPTRNISTFISHYFRDKHMISGEIRPDPTRVARTKTNSFPLSFSNPIDCSDLWSSLTPQESGKLELPILILDYLEGVEDYIRFFRGEDEFYIKVSSKDYSHYLKVFNSLYKKVYGEALKEPLVPKTPANRYLLDTALKYAFPVISLKQFLAREEPHLSEVDLKIGELNLRKELQKMSFTQGVLSEGRNQVNSSISGFSYLVLATLYLFLKED